MLALRLLNKGGNKTFPLSTSLEGGRPALIPCQSRGEAACLPSPPAFARFAELRPGPGRLFSAQVSRLLAFASALPGEGWTLLSLRPVSTASVLVDRDRMAGSASGRRGGALGFCNASAPLGVRRHVHPFTSSVGVPGWPKSAASQHFSMIFATSCDCPKVHPQYVVSACLTKPRGGRIVSLRRAAVAARTSQLLAWTR